MQDLRMLVIFVKVAERLSFVRAAAELGITQSGVSNAISRLEGQIGTRLLARTTRHVSLTEHGGVFFERCRQALAEIEEAELLLKDAQLRPTGNLRVDMPMSFGRLKVLPLLGTFQAQYPDLKLRVTFNNRYIDLIEEGVDVAVRLGQLQDSSLIARRLAGTQFYVVGAPSYFANHGKPKRIDDLAAHDCLAFTYLETRLVRPWRFIEGGVRKMVTPKGTMSFSDIAAVCDAAVAGYGVAQLQGYFVDALIKSGGLVAVLEKFKPQLEPAWLVYPPTRHLSPKVRVFVDFMATHLKGGADAPRRSVPARERGRAAR
jgi:DNA-binding transcriptional LysR family regulator